jgi:hypothetical protein
VIGVDPVAREQRILFLKTIYPTRKTTRNNARYKTGLTEMLAPPKKACPIKA